MLKPPSTARTAGRSDWAERRFRRQPFILLSFSSSKKARKAQETQSYQRFQCIGHAEFKGFSNAVTSPSLLPSMGITHQKGLGTIVYKTAHVRFHSRKWVHPRLHSKDRTQRLTRRNRGGVSDGGAITTLGAFRTFTNIPGPGVRTAYFAALGSWPGGALEERRKPSGQRCAYACRCSEAPRPRWAA